MGQLFKCIVEVLMNHGSYEGGGGGEVVLVVAVALAFRASWREDLGFQEQHVSRRPVSI